MKCIALWGIIKKAMLARVGQASLFYVDILVFIEVLDVFTIRNNSGLRVLSASRICEVFFHIRNLARRHIQGGNQG